MRAEVIRRILADIEDLRRELEDVENAIKVFERLAKGGSPRRGRPPAWLKRLGGAGGGHGSGSGIQSPSSQRSRVVDAPPKTQVASSDPKV